MAFVIELGGCFGDLDGFACIGQFNRLCLIVQHHAVGRFCFSDRIFAEVQRFACGVAVFIGGYSVDNRTLGIAECAVRRDNVLGGGNLIDRTCETFICKNKAVYAVRFHSGEEDLAAF